MSAVFDRNASLDAFDRIGRATALAGTKLQIPTWISGPARRLQTPWFTANAPSDAMREYLTFSSPAEFASRNIFTEERPLRRARGPHSSK